MFTPKFEIVSPESGTNASTMNSIHNKELSDIPGGRSGSESLATDEKRLNNPPTHTSKQESGERVDKVGTAAVAGMVAAKEAVKNKGDANASTLTSIPK